MSDDNNRPPEDEENAEPEVAPSENHDGTAPTTEDKGKQPENPKRDFLPILRQRAADGGLNPNDLLTLTSNLSTTLQDKADQEEDRAEQNKATARVRLGVHLKALVFVLGGGLVIFGASSELLDLSDIDLGLNGLPTWVLMALVSAIPISMAFFGWHEIGRLRASFIKHQQERAGFGVYQQEIIALERDCPLIFDGQRQEKHRPSADAIVKAHPATMRLFRHYRAALVTTAVAVTGILATLALQAGT